MKPLQVYLSDRGLDRNEAWARRRGWTKSQAVRAALRALTGVAGEDALLAASGMIDGLPRDGAERFEDDLLRGYVAERPAAYRRQCKRTAARPS